MNRQFPIQNQNGLTFVEILAVLIITGILAALAVTRYISFEENARKKGVNFGVNELNAMENLAWSDEKISGSGYISDAKIYGMISYDIGSDYTWNTGDPTPTGGTMTFQGESFALSRTSSSPIKPAVWNLN